MAEYQLPVDIGNRALQCLGATRMVALTDNSKNAAAVAFCYDKLRRAELERNNWRFGIKTCALRAIDDTVMLLQPGTYNAADSYPIGAIVTFNGTWYQATQVVAANTPPDANPLTWDQYSGPDTVVPWAVGANPNLPPQYVATTAYAITTQVLGSDGNIYQSLINGNTGNNPVTDGGVHWQLVGAAPAGPGYYAGELVYILSGTTVSVYMALIQGATDVPGVIDAWTSTITYNKGDTVTYSATTYQSAIDLNLGNVPGGAQWIAVPGTEAQQMVGQQWLWLKDASLESFRIVYPIGAGPQNQSTTRNAFRLPVGYLKLAPQDPRAGSASYLGAPSGINYTDWVEQDDYLTTRDQTVIILRYMADIVNVNRMNAMFCEGLARRIAEETCEEITQSVEKMQVQVEMYKRTMGEARTANAIEEGSDEPPIDDWIACRI